MKWLGNRESSNVEDRRGMSGGKMIAGGGVAGLIVYLLYTLLSGNPIDPDKITNQVNSEQNQSKLSPEQQAEDDQKAKFVKTVLAETEDEWNKIFRQAGQYYQEPILVLYRDAVNSGCGNARSSTGPFYCPGDNKLYIDLSFYQDLQDKLNAPGDFAMAYVIAHEVGHHVQNLQGISAKINELRSRVSETEFNRYSVQMELQADFYAGVWAHYAQKTKNILEAGDIEEAMNAANAIGDDRLQKQSTGRIVPDAFTHGTSAQRMYWFKKGFETGDLKKGDTFNDPTLK